MSYIRSNAEAIGIPDNYFAERDIHIHVPSGATPKDGPSAGVTMLTALTSLATDRIVRKNMAMTGEITLRGTVLPVGGVKEKVLAAHRAGVKTIIMPKWNKKDLEDIPAKVSRDITFHFLEDMMDVLRLALEKQPTARENGKSEKN
jgi:ATP-dependent Lon protease